MSAVEVLGGSARGEEIVTARIVVEGERILEADTPGMSCPLDGLTLLEAAAVPGEALAADAVADALAQVLHAERDERRVAVAMSGGVDSAVALLRAGPHGVGVTLRLWLDPRGPGAERVCCSPSAVLAARETCHALGRPHVTLDLRREFRRAVVRPFVEGYAKGFTPNPCVRCNGSFRFDALADASRRLGAGRLWTGHYARIVERDGIRLIARGADEQKDQSYMLATVAPGLLANVDFPLGGQTKAETRAEAAGAGLSAAATPESQEACFLAGGDYRDFLEREGVDPAPGPIVDEGGRELGRHGGVWRFTPGQRRGLGVAGGGGPLYALRADAGTGTLVVGSRASLACRRVEVSGTIHVPVSRGRAKLRYRSSATSARIAPAAGGFVLELDEPAYAVAPGQVAAVYDREAIVASGVIAAVTG